MVYYQIKVIMKSVLFIAYLVISTACASQKEITAPVDNVSIENSEQDKMLTGTVRVSDRGCPLFLEVYENGKLITMYPVNLDEKLKIDGTRIKFSYIPSRAMQPEKCLVDKVVSLVEVIELL